MKNILRFILVVGFFGCGFLGFGQEEVIKYVRNFETKGFVSSVAFSPNGQYVLTGSWDNTAKLWSIDGSLIKTFKGHNAMVNSVKFSPNGQYVLTGSSDETAKLWSIDGSLIKTFKGHNTWVNSVKFSPNGQYILTGSDKTAKLWSIDGSLIRTFKGHNNWIYSVVFSPNGQYILTGSKDGTIKLWKSGLPPISSIPLSSTSSSTITHNIQWHTPDEYDYANKTYELNEAKFPIKINISFPKKLELFDLSFHQSGSKLGNASLIPKGKDNNGNYRYTYFNTLTFQKGGIYNLQLNIQKGGISVSSKALKVRYVPEKINLYVLTVGANPQGDLNYTDDDAKDIAAVFRNHNLYKTTTVKILTNEKARASNIKVELSRIKTLYERGNLTDRDMVVIFLSSRGITRSEEEFYVEGEDFSMIDFDATAISLKHINDRLAGVKCKKILLIDACHSGTTDMALLSATNKGKLKAAQNALNNLRKKMNGWVVLTSSGTEPSWENNKWKNGAFTEALLVGLQDGKADANKNGFISINELYQYVKLEVPELNRAVGYPNQYPQMQKNELGDLEIYEVRN